MTAPLSDGERAIEEVTMRFKTELDVIYDMAAKISSQVQTDSDWVRTQATREIILHAMAGTPRTMCWIVGWLAAEGDIDSVQDKVVRHAFGSAHPSLVMKTDLKPRQLFEEVSTEVTNCVDNCVAMVEDYRSGKRSVNAPGTLQ